MVFLKFACDFVLCLGNEEPVLKKEMPIVINNVLPGSIAQEAGIETGDVLLSINGESIEDIFDYRFLISDEELTLEIRKEDGEIWEIDIEKFEDEDLGIEFIDELIDEAKSCSNKCIFCFIDQMPKGMRESLYFKDDDMRLSFLSGNYVTLTNMDDSHIDRIIKYRMSPINISVHTTNPDLRVFMLKNRFAANIMGKIRKLAVSGIILNCQIVLCNGINDGDELYKSLMDLTKLYPAVNSISIVPVGITKHREGLCKLEPYDKASSMEVIKKVEKLQKEFLKKHGSRIVYLADEFYIMAGKEIPGYGYYEDFPQIENGVGLIARLKYEFDDYIKNACFNPQKKRKVSIVTGVSAYNYISLFAKRLEEKYGITVYVYKIINDFFGENVTVTGLLTGRDIVAQVSGRDLGDEVLICKCMLKADTDLLLDDYTVGMLEEALGVKVTPVENSGKCFINSILGI
jgi:putative radical SAM enzyme (TIGR03279 family)